MKNSFPVVEAGPGSTRQVLTDAPDLMVERFTLQEVGAEGAMHSHPHVQSTFALSGRYRFAVGAESFEVGPGDSFIIPSSVEHGCVCLEPGALIDTFTPRREDFL